MRKTKMTVKKQARNSPAKQTTKADQPLGEEAEKAAEAKKAAIPVFNESGRTTIVGGLKGIKYRQKGNHFSASKEFVGKAE